jgi:DNA-binding beta-propeller fold protein YncE
MRRHGLHTVLAVALIAITTSRAHGGEPLQLLQTIALTGVSGRIDHLAVDVAGRRLFVAALGNNTVEVVDLRQGRRVHTITGLHEPQGVVFVPEWNRIFVANGAGGAVNVFDGASFSLLTTIQFSDDADNLRYDAATQQVYVGFGGGALGVVAARDGMRRGDLALPGHPESFELEAQGSRIFVNVPNASQIAVIDRAKGAVVAAWTSPHAHANFPMALDEAGHRLLVGFRKPPTLIVFDTDSGRTVATLAIPGDCDDVFYDRTHQRAYISGGEGFLDVLAQRDRDHYMRTSRLTTVAGARTSLFVPELDRLYLAVPRHGEHAAEVRVYAVQP